MNIYFFKKYEDNTEDIGEKIKEYLIENSFFTKRLVSAFLNLRMRLEKLKVKLRMINITCKKIYIYVIMITK